MRVFKFKITGVLAAIAIISLLVSCESFLNGLELIEALDESIEFANAEEVDLSITVDNKHGTLTGAASGTYKVSEKRQYSIAFSESDSSQFFKWKILDASGNESENGKYIKINNPKSTATEFIIVGSANGFTITPYCETRPSIKSATPVYQANGISRDREILVTFDRVLPVSNFYYTESELSALGVDETCTLKKNPDGTIFGYIKNGNCVIKNITIVADYGSENLGKYFSQCYIDGQILHIKPDSDVKNRYEMDIGNIKDIVVTISNICDGEIKMRQDYTWNYRTNPNTDVQAIVKIANSVTTIKCNVGESNELSYTPASEYQFKNWEVWIIDSTGRETQVTEEDKYISFIDKNNSASPFTILDVPEGTIHLVPNCVERPVVLATTPIFSNSGCFRDEQITVLFSKDMDENSIYFDESEIPSGKVKIYSTREGKTGKIYAYADSVNEDPVTVSGTTYYNYTYVNKVYKNIEIINLNSQVSLTEYFAEPFFETPSKLIIKTARKIKSDGSSEAVAPPSSCHIIATISKEMYSMLDDVAIKLPTNKKLYYMTNESIDIDPPQLFTDESNPIIFRRNNGTEDVDIETTAISTSTTFDNLYNYLVYDNKLKLFLHFKDTASGPEAIYMHYKRVLNSNYNGISESEKIRQLSCKKATNGQDAYFTSDLKKATQINPENLPDVVDISDFEDGAYRIYFSVKDINGNEANSEYYYLLKDTKDFTVSNFSYNHDNKKFSWTNSKKFYKTEISYKNLTQNNDSKTTEKSKKSDFTSSATVPAFANTVPSEYTVTINFYDLYDKLIVSKTIDTCTTLKPPTITQWATGELPQWVEDEIRKAASSSPVHKDTYGRNVVLTAPAGVTVGYKLYSGDTLIGTYDSTSFKIPYREKAIYYNYNIRSYYKSSDGHEFLSSPTADKQFFETRNELLFAYALLSNNDVLIRFGVMYPKSIYNKAMDLDMHWRKYRYRDEKFYPYTDRKNQNIWSSISGSADWAKYEDEYYDSNYHYIVGTDHCGIQDNHFGYLIQNADINDNIFTVEVSASTNPNPMIKFRREQYATDKY